MLGDWQEYTGGESSLVKRNRMHVTMNPGCQIYISRNAFEALGKPAAVRMFYDVGRSRIGVMGSARGAKTFDVIQPRLAAGGYIRGSSFCRHYGIKPEATVVFQDVAIDANGMMVLDLKTARRRR